MLKAKFTLGGNVEILATQPADTIKDEVGACIFMTDDELAGLVFLASSDKTPISEWVFLDPMHREVAERDMTPDIPF